MKIFSENKQWYKDLDISPKGRPVGIEQIDKMSPDGACYCMISHGDIVDHVDMYEDGQKIHYKKFRYDDLGRVIENMMYSPDGQGGWHIVDDIWYYEYDPQTGVRAKKIMKMPGASKAREILYNPQSERTSEATINLEP